MKIFLDDDRNPADPSWVVTRTVPHLMDLIDKHGDEITALSFDNDLRQPEDGWMAVRDIVDRRVDAVHDGTHFLPLLNHIAVHSANVEASTNMMGRLESAARAGFLPGIEIAHKPATSHDYPLAAEDSRKLEVYAPETPSKSRVNAAARASAFAAIMGQGR